MRVSRMLRLHRRRRAVSALAVCVGVAFASGVALASTVSGRVSGQVVSVHGKSFVVKLSQSLVAEGYPSSSTVSVGSAPIRDDVPALRSALKAGVCVTAMGTSASGVIDATFVTISFPLKGSCAQGGFSGHHYTSSGAPRSGSFPSGGASRPFTGFGSGNFAFGSITSVDGSTLTVKGTTFEGKSNSSKVKVGSGTKLTLERAVGASAISKGQCVQVTGSSSNNGVDLVATAITLSTPTPSGCTRPSLFGGR